MTVAGQTQSMLDKPSRFSFWFITGVLAVTALLHLGGPLVVILFSFFALTKLNFLPKRGPWVAVGLFLFLGAVLAYGLGQFINQMVKALPDIADRAIPVVIEWAKTYKMELPFTDYDGLKESAREAIRSQMHYVSSIAQLARGAASQIVLCIVGIVIAIAMFLNRGFEPKGRAPVSSDSVYGAYTTAITARFKTFYESFATVMGAQIVISAINTVLTAIFVLAMQMPHALLIIGATFICGLLPIVGNLLSNTIIVSVGITVSPKIALICLVFLIVVHKLEYFLNSKIVGDRIRNPFWLTLLGLIIGERLMGIPGMILAPVVLNYIKVEASRIKQSKIDG